MTTKTCKKCGGIMDATGDWIEVEGQEDLVRKPIWKCRCCWVEIPRRVYITKKAIEKRERMQRVWDSLVAEGLIK